MQLNSAAFGHSCLVGLDQLDHQMTRF